MISDYLITKLSTLTDKMPKGPSASQPHSEHGLTDEDIEKMVSDAVFYFLVADQKKSMIKVKCNIFLTNETHLAPFRSPSYINTATSVGRTERCRRTCSRKQ